MGWGWFSVITQGTYTSHNFQASQCMHNPRVGSLHGNLPIKNMELLFYPKLGTRSRRALTRRFRQTHRGQQPHTYRPKGTLLTRLAHESGMTVEQVWAQLGKEREYLLNQESKV